MLARGLVGLVGLVGGLSVFLTGALAHAQCTKDTDCKGERVCTGGACVSPPPEAAPRPGAATPPAASPPAQQARPSQRAIGFSNLVFRLERGDVIGIAGQDFRIHILEDLRRRGLNAVGAESLVFGNDRGDSADLTLGGTVTELECRRGSAAGQVTCRMG